MSSAWTFSAAKTWLRMPSTIGCSSQTRLANSIAQGRAVEVEAVAGIDLALPVQRQMIAIF